MDKTFHFMSGLPRSGSTMLSAILNQNPRIHSGPSSPVVATILALEESLMNDELFSAYPKIEAGKKIISSVLPNFYFDVENPIVIDKNRSWVNRVSYIRGYFKIEKPKILCPVRDIAEILTSFITMIRRKPVSDSGKMNFIDAALIKSNIRLTDENRCQFLAGMEGILGQSYEGLRQVIGEGNVDCIHLIEYSDLVGDTDNTMRKIYDFLEEEYFEHDFTNLVNLHQENDGDIYGLEDMHKVRSVVGSVAPKPEDILPENVIASCVNAEFWRDLENFKYE